MRNLLARFRQFPSTTRNLIATCIYGLAAGGGAVLFQSCINVIYANTFGRLITHSVGAFLLGTGGMLVGSTLLVGWLLTRFAPEAAGSGIPQLKVAFWKDFGYVPFRVAWVKFVAGVLSVGGGSSLGREGPSVQIGGVLTSTLAGFFGEAKQKRRLAFAAGAAGGLAAAFNTPLAAVTFVLEEVIGDLNSRLLGSILLASVLGASLVHAVIGRQPAFHVAETLPPDWGTYVAAPFAAAAIALAGVGFHKAILGLRGYLRRVWRPPVWTMPVIGGLITWDLGAAVFFSTGLTGVYGLGYKDLTAGLDHHLIWQFALILLLAKFAATVACYATGGCGGIFAPTLFLGSMCGLVVAAAAHLFVPISDADQTALALVGMSAFFGAVVRAPVTGILIIFEMTQDFALVPALMLAALVSQAVSRYFLKSSFYDALLEQDGVELDHTIPPRDLRGWLSRPVAAIANLRPVVVTDLAPDVLRPLLEKHPFACFPVQINGTPLGLVGREEIIRALAENRPPKVGSALTCKVTTPLRDVQSLLVTADHHVVLLEDHGRLAGLLTLHDLLRAEVNHADQGG